jgi:pimeloyl-ACP methyl ester carboxylesterase
VLGAGLVDETGADGVVSLSAAGSTEIAESVGRLELPVLFVAARDDFPAFEMANQLYRAAENAESRQLLILDGALHANMLLRPDAPTKLQVEQEILAFLHAL